MCASLFASGFAVPSVAYIHPEFLTQETALLEVLYADNFLWQTPRRLERSGAIQQNAVILSGHESVRYLYGGQGSGGFGSVVGVTGAFQITPNAGLGLLPDEREKGGRFGFIFVEFTPARPVSGTQPTGSIIAHDHFPRDADTGAENIEVRFDRIGTYRVWVYTTLGGSPRVNYYDIVVRNGVREGDNAEFEVRGRFAHQQASAVSFHNTNQPTTIDLSFEVRGTSGVSHGLDLFCRTVPESVLFTRASVQLLNSDGEDVFEYYFHPPTWSLEDTRLTIQRREETELPNGIFQIRTYIRFQFTDINTNGVINTPNINTNPQAIYATLIITDPPRPARFPWWALLVGFAVLGSLGGAFYGTRYLINRTSDAHTGKLTRKMRERGEADERNIQKLRTQIMDEHQEDVDIEALAPVYTKFYTEVNEEIAAEASAELVKEKKSKKAK